jgi:hypothetical protein
LFVYAAMKSIRHWSVTSGNVIIEGIVGQGIKQIGHSYGFLPRKTRLDMPPMKSVWVILGLVPVLVQSLGTDTLGQAVAFTPNIAAAPTGQTMTVTPVVSPDRRYVRLSVNPFFNVINGFSSFTTPLGAVSGAGGVGGGAGGLGGGGLRAVGVGAGGGNFSAGMNGVIGPAGLDDSVAFGQIGFGGQVGEMRAGAFPYDDGFGGGLYTGSAPGWTGWDDSAYLSAHARPRASKPPSETNRAPGATASAKSKTVPSPRHATRKSVSRPQKARPSHTAKVKEPSDEEPIVKPKKVI